MKKALLFTIFLASVATSPRSASARLLPFGWLSCSELQMFSVPFGSSSATVSSAIAVQLTAVAAAMRENPDCRVVITGNAGGTKTTQQLSWDRVEAIIVYMGNVQNIDRNRFIFSYEGDNGQGADVVTATFVDASTEGPSSTPPPHPDLRSR